MLVVCVVTYWGSSLLCMWCPTSRVIECSFCGLPALSTVALVKRQTLLPCPSHHLKVAWRVFWLSKVSHPVHFATAGVRHVQNFSHWVHGQVVLMSRAGAGRRGCTTLLQVTKRAKFIKLISSVTNTREWLWVSCSVYPDWHKQLLVCNMIWCGLNCYWQWELAYFTKF